MKRSALLFIPSILVLMLSSCNETVNNDLYAVNKASRTVFNIGDEFTLEGLLLINPKTGEEITSYSSSIEEGYVFQMKDLGERTVTISKANYNPYSYTINVTNYERLVIEEYPKTEFEVGDSFVTTGLVVVVNGEVISDYTVSISTSTVFSETGTRKVEISKEGYASAWYEINIYPKKELFIESLPDSTVFTEGDEFTASGLVVKDERGNVVTDYYLNIQEGQTLKGEGVKTITIAKDGYISTSFTIQVNKNESGTIYNRTVNIYYMNDTHGSYSRYDEEYEAGMAYISSYIKDHKDEYTVVLSGGDMFQGGFESNETKGAIMVDAMNEIGFDAMVLGNHELDWGEAPLINISEDLNCPIISANTFYSDKVSRPSWLTPYVILNKGDVRIGIIGGAETDMMGHVTGSIAENFYNPNATGYIQYYSTELRNNHGCDIILAAFHDGGLSGNSGSATNYDTLTHIDPATGMKYVDGMFFAHDHKYKEGVAQDVVPYLESCCNGKGIGIMTFNVSGNSISYSIDSFSTTNMYAYSNCTTYDDAFADIDAKYKSIMDKGNEVVYTFKNSYDADSFTPIVCMAMYWYVNSHEDEFDYTDVSMASHNKGGIRNDIPVGDLTYKMFTKVFPFENCISIQTCSKANINNYNNYDYYVTYGTPIYESDGYCYVASINYITERASNNWKYQQSYKNYPNANVKDILYTYLKERVNPNL